MKERKIYLDVVRIIACFLVIVNHTNSRIFQTTEISPTWFASITYFFICKVAVPLFIMISGATLLNKQDSYRKTFSRVIRIVWVIILFSLIYYINNCYLNDTVFSIKEFLVSIYQKGITNAFWYLYLYIGILVMMPILQRMTPVLTQRDFKYFFGISFGFLGTMPILIHYNPNLQYSKYIEFPLFTTYIALLFAGYYIAYKCRIRRKVLGALNIASIICIAASVILTYHEYTLNPKKYLFFDNRYFITIVIPSICLFANAKYWCEKKQLSGWFKMIVTKVGRCTFGIYLLSDLFIQKLAPINEMLKMQMHPLGAVVIYEILVFLSGLVVTMLLIRIPYIKKLI